MCDCLRLLNGFFQSMFVILFDLLITHRKYLAPVITTLVQERRNSSTPSRRSSERGSSDQSTNVIANAFAHKALVIRTTRNEHAEEVFARSKRLLENCNVSVIDCRYNNNQCENLESL